MSAPNRLIVLLHGVGTSGANLLPLGQAWSAGPLPSTAIAAPDAPDPFPYGMGHQWFSVAGVTAENREARILAARAGFDRVVAKAIADAGFEGRPDRVALVGFSQGTIMALDAVARGRWPVGAVVGYSGRLATALPDEASGLSFPPVLLVHGDADDVIASAETVRAAERLGRAGVAVEHHILPGVPHTITGDGAALGARFIADHIG